jgi:hypothetical protein
MATVHLPSSLSAYTDGLDEVAIEAGRVRELMLALAARFPGLAERLDGMAVAIDGQIYNDADYQPLRPDSQVHLVPRIAGG